MTPAFAILAVLSALPVHTTDVNEPPTAREPRLLIEAQAIAQACGNDVKCAAALLTIADAETHSAGFVGRGECSKGPVGARCDEGRAASYWQVWTSAAPACRDAHNTELPLAEQHNAAAQCALARWRTGVKVCSRQFGVAGAFEFYKRSRCEPPKFMSPAKLARDKREMAERAAELPKMEARLFAARRASK